MLTLSEIRKTDEWIEANIYNHDSKEQGYIKLSLIDYKLIAYKSVFGLGVAANALKDLVKIGNIPEKTTFCFY